MASNVIAAVLNLKDNMSKKLAACTLHWKDLSAEQARAVKVAQTTVGKWGRSLDKAIDKTIKWGAALAATTAIAGAKIGFSMAFDMETYRSQLETATKDTKRAGEVMNYAISLANKTPFEGGEMASAAAALEMAKLNTEDYLTTLGDTAAGTNRKLSEVQTQFIKAFSTGQYGEFFDSINVSRQTFKEFVRENGLATNSIANTQVALKRFLDDKFGGGMEKLARTTKGAWSTITGSVKLSLARIIGMGSDGTVRIGSLLDRVNNKAVGIADKLVEWSEDGTIDGIVEKLDVLLTKIWDIGAAVFGFFEKNEWARNLAGALVVALLIWKAFSKILSSVTKVIKNIGILKTALGAVGKKAAGGAAAEAAGKAVTKAAGKSVAKSVAKSGSEAALGKAMATGASSLGMLGVFAGGTIAAAGAGYLAYRQRKKQLDTWKAFQSGDYYTADKIAGVKVVDLNTGKVRDVTEDDYTSKDVFDENGKFNADYFTQHGSVASNSGPTTHNITVNVSGAGKTDEELADTVAKKIVEEMDNTW